MVAQRRPAQIGRGLRTCAGGLHDDARLHRDRHVLRVRRSRGRRRHRRRGLPAGCGSVGVVRGRVFTGDLAPGDVTADDSISYDVDGFDGRSIQRVEITEPGQYSVAVTGDDLTVVAALGRDPDDGVDGLRRAASDRGDRRRRARPAAAGAVGPPLQAGRDRGTANWARAGCRAARPTGNRPMRHGRRSTALGPGAGQPARAGCDAATGPGAGGAAGDVATAIGPGRRRTPRPRTRRREHRRCRTVTGGSREADRQSRRITVTTRPKMLTSSAGNRIGSIVGLDGIEHDLVALGADTS